MENPRYSKPGEEPVNPKAINGHNPSGEHIQKLKLSSKSKIVLSNLL